MENLKKSNWFETCNIANLEEVKSYLKDQKKSWFDSIVNSDDFSDSDSEEIKERVFKEIIEDDFLSRNDVCDLIDDDDELNEIAQELRSEALREVLIEFQLTESDLTERFEK